VSKEIGGDGWSFTIQVSGKWDKNEETTLRLEARC